MSKNLHNNKSIISIRPKCMSFIKFMIGHFFESTKRREYKLSTGPATLMRDVIITYLSDNHASPTNVSHWPH